MVSIDKIEPAGLARNCNTEIKSFIDCSDCTSTKLSKNSTTKINEEREDHQLKTSTGDNNYDQLSNSDTVNLYHSCTYNLRRSLQNDVRISRVTKALFILAFIFIVLSCLALYLNGPDYILSQILRRMLVLEKESDFYKSWVKIQGDNLFISFFIFNLTNKEEFLAGHERAELQKVGPISYRFEVLRQIIDEDTENNSLTYWNKRNHYFSRQLTDPNIDPKTTLVTYPNLPKIQILTAGKIGSLADTLFSWPWLGGDDDTQDLFVTKTIEEFLWGYDHDLLQLGRRFVSGLPPKYGLLSDQNATHTYSYTVKNGKDKPEELLQIVDIRDVTGKPLTCWNSEKANLSYLKSTDIEQVSPKKFRRKKFSYSYFDILSGTEQNSDENSSDNSNQSNINSNSSSSTNETKTISVYIEDAFRPFDLDFVGQFEHPFSVKSKSSWPIPVDRYALDSPSFNGEYCPSDQRCPFKNSGLIDIGACKNLKFSLLWSQPYFHSVSNSSFQQQILNSIKGPDFQNLPKKDYLETYIDIEPNSGVVISAKRRAQISVSFETHNAISKFPESVQRLKTKIYPIFYYDFPYEASTSIKKDLSEKLVAGKEILRLLPYTLIILAFTMIFVALILNLHVRDILKRKINMKRKFVMEEGLDAEEDKRLVRNSEPNNKLDNSDINESPSTCESTRSSS